MTRSATAGRARKKRQAAPRPAPCITASELDRLPAGPRAILPWPERVLSPNARASWHAVHKAKKLYRKVSAWEAFAAGFHLHRAAFKTEEEVHMRMDFFPPPNVNSYDRDNIHASMKAAQDGLADTLKIDDGLFRPDYRHHRERCSCVVVTLLLPKGERDAG